MYQNNKVIDLSKLRSTFYNSKVEQSHENFHKIME